MQQKDKLVYEDNIINKISSVVKYLTGILGMQIVFFYIQQSINSNLNNTETYYREYISIIQYMLLILLTGYICCKIRLIYLACIKKVIIKELLQIIIQICLGSFILYVVMEEIGIESLKMWFFFQLGVLGWIVLLGILSFVVNYIYQEEKLYCNTEGKEIFKDETYIPSLLDNVMNVNLKNYIAHQLYTYAIRARFYKRAYYICSIISLTAPCIVVVINSLMIEEGIQRTCVAVFSSMAAIASGLLGLVKFKDSWIRYRYNCERLKLEIVKYVNDVDEYEAKNEQERSKLLSVKVDKIVSEETYDWRQLRDQNCEGNI